MRILKNQNFIQRQSDNYIKAEMSNVAAVISSPQVITRYFQIDTDASTTVNGLKNIEDYIGPTSTVRYDVIENLPMAGINNLISQSQFDEDLGFEEDFTSSGIILPNTIVPKPNDFFMVVNSEVSALYAVIDKSQVTVRSNPFTEIQFRLYTRDPEIIAQLEKQVKDTYRVTVTAIGMDKTLVVHKKSLFTIEHHVDQYLDLCDLYITHFYDEQKSAFVFDGLPGVDGTGCPGYITGNDILDGTDGGWREEFGDTETIPTATIDQIQDLTNGMTINERGDKFYIVDGEPVIVPGYVPYWLVRNHEDRYGDANNMPGQQCQYCCNKTCCNCSLNDQYQAFLADPNHKTNKIIVRQVFIDMTLWKLMFDRGIVIYDDVLTYANNNFNREIDRVYTDCPNIYVDEHLYKRSVLNRLVTHDFKHNPFEYCQLTCSEADPRIAKFQGKNIYYLESYDKYRSCNLNTGYYDIWDEEFQWRIKNCKPYSTDMIRVPVSDSCNSCTAQYPYYYPFNRSLRNAIILGYNRKPIDWENLEIESEWSIENYTLIPIVLSYYKEYISSLQR